MRNPCRNLRDSFYNILKLTMKEVNEEVDRNNGE